MACSRRDFFHVFGRSLASDVFSVAGTLRSEWMNRTAPEAELPARSWLRPPGALPEPLFLTTCTKCTSCQEVCPYQSIRRLGPEFGDCAGTPVIVLDESPCYLCPDMPCIASCPTRALQPTPRHEVRMGLAVVNDELCYRSAGQPCDYCVVRCPLNSDAIRFDGSGPPRVQAEGCTGCGVCAYLCPGKAIKIQPVNSLTDGPAKHAR